MTRMPIGGAPLPPPPKPPMFIPIRYCGTVTHVVAAHVVLIEPLDLRPKPQWCYVHLVNGRVLSSDQSPEEVMAMVEQSIREWLKVGGVS